MCRWLPSSHASQSWSPLHVQRVPSSASDPPPDMRLRDSRESDMEGMRHSRKNSDRKRSDMEGISISTMPFSCTQSSRSGGSCQEEEDTCMSVQTAVSANSRAPTPEAICLHVESCMLLPRSPCLAHTP